MRRKMVMAGLTAAALIAAVPAYAQSTATDKPQSSMTDKVKSMTREAKAGMSDSWLTSKTKIALFSDSRVKGRQVSVTTQKGVVTLRGKVDSSEAKAVATDIAKSIDGVKSVRNELQIVAPSARAAVDVDDKQIYKNVEQKFQQDPALKKIDPKVEAGVVILTGEVKNIGTSAKASEVARSVPGVKYVKNDLTFASRSSLEPSTARK
jgi:hyperosmotically inducible protein